MQLTTNKYNDLLLDNLVFLLQPRPSSTYWFSIENCFITHIIITMSWCITWNVKFVFDQDLSLQVGYKNVVKSKVVKSTLFLKGREVKVKFVSNKVL